jgi:copper transport protein
MRLAAVVAAVLAAATLAPAAVAHSVLIATEPGRGRTVAEAPDRVLLRFDEGVETAVGDLRVYNGSGEPVDTGEITQPRPEEVVVAVEDGLARGTYTVAWHAISADSDPISGAFVFHVQAPGPHPSGIAAEVLRDTPAVVSVFYTGGRFFDFALLLLCAGGAAALAIALPWASVSLRRRLWGVIAVLAAALTLVALIGIPLQGAAAGDLTLREAFTWDVISAVAETRYGKVMLIQAGLALALAGTALALRRAPIRYGGALTALALVLAAGLTVTPSASGHASTSGTAAFVADLAHVVAAAVWTGGLGFVVLALLLARSDRWPLASHCVPRFSNMAVVSVAVLLVAGAVNGYLQVRTWSGLWETTYGLLLLAKIALVVPLLALGAFNNRYAVPRLRAGIASLLERRRFLRAAGAELTIMVAVVAVTAVLVNAEPARTELGMHGGSEEVVADLGDMEAHVMVEPGTSGRNAIHLRFEGGEEEGPGLEEVNVAASLPSSNVGPLRYKAKQESAGHDGEYVVENAQLSIPGDWQLRIEARMGEFDLLTGTVSIPIREES